MKMFELNELSVRYSGHKCVGVCIHVCVLVCVLRTLLETLSVLAVSASDSALNIHAT